MPTFQMTRSEQSFGESLAWLIGGTHQDVMDLHRGRSLQLEEGLRSEVPRLQHRPVLGDLRAGALTGAARAQLVNRFSTALLIKNQLFA